MKKVFATLCFVFCFIGAQLCAPASAFAATEIQDTEIEATLYGLIDPLANAAGVPAGRMKIHIINDNDFNAFVMGGEDVYIFTGLITTVESPVAFQAVIAHELGHMMGGHMAQMSAEMRAQMVRSLIVQALGVALAVAGGNPGLGMGVVAGAGGMAQSGLNAFSRNEERLADNAGLKLLAAAGLDPTGLLDVMKQMNDIHSGIESKINPYAISHPMTSERMENVKKWLADHKTKNEKRKTKNEVEKYTLIRAKIIGYLSSPDRVMAMYPESDTSTPAVYARAIMRMQMGNLADARMGALALITAAKNNPYYYELLGDIEYQYGHYDDSVKAYEKSLSLIGGGDAPQIQVALALVLSERGKPGDADRAVEMCKRAQLVQKSPLSYWVLARAENTRGNAGISDWAMAEYYAAAHNADKAKEYARRAQKELPKNGPEYLKSADILKSTDIDADDD
ncbi:MAG: M48 family metalloprotease [Proteobacteria bacterium]|nr:M48 family metalloprotease [Pseudomonadota bacterium]